MVHYIDKPALLYATTYVLQLVVIHTSEEAEEDALFGNSARVRGLKIGGHWSLLGRTKQDLWGLATIHYDSAPRPKGSYFANASVYSCNRSFELTNKICYFHGYQRSRVPWIKNPYAGVCSLLAFYI